MRKGDLIKEVAEKTQLSKDKASKAVDVFINTITEALENDEGVTLTGFGAFKRRHRGERKGKNPQTGKPMVIPACSTVSFKPGKALKERVNC
ncbi:MAG: HU family DNA-binding protein [Endozoicomonadaceae bacterium]|nr:HU family DNA-binding protein [Endozoicomonadaceae bacterium]